MQSRRFSGLPLIGILAVIYFISRQTRFDAGVIARECIAGMAAGGNRACRITLARLSRVAGHLYRCISGERYDRGKCGYVICHRHRQHARGARGAWLVNRFAGGTNSLIVHKAFSNLRLRQGLVPSLALLSA